MSTLDNLRRLIRPLQTRVSNLVARAVVQLVDDSAKQQLVQLGVMVGEDIDDGEHFHPYGFSSVPLVGAEAVALFPGGDRGHPLVVAVSDRRHRPTGKPGGHVCVYHHTGAIIEFTETGDVAVTPAPGRQVLLGSASASDPPALTSELATLKSAITTAKGAAVAGDGGVAAFTSLEASIATGWPVGATKVKAE